VQRFRSAARQCHQWQWRRPKLETEALGLATFFKGGRHFPHLLHDRNGYDGASHIVSIDESGRLIKSFAYDTRDRLAGDGTLRRKYYSATSII
jgi:hypothetical protein